MVTTHSFIQALFGGGIRREAWINYLYTYNTGEHYGKISSYSDNNSTAVKEAF